MRRRLRWMAATFSATDYKLGVGNGRTCKRMSDMAGTAPERHATNQWGTRPGANLIGVASVLAFALLEPAASASAPNLYFVEDDRRDIEPMKRRASAMRLDAPCSEEVIRLVQNKCSQGRTVRREFSTQRKEVENAPTFPLFLANTGSSNAQNWNPLGYTWSNHAKE